ncbi:MAG: lytic transglycosylase domain-containing protein [Bacteriovoracia bacterium]
MGRYGAILIILSFGFLGTISGQLSGKSEQSLAEVLMDFSYPSATVQASVPHAREVLGEVYSRGIAQLDEAHGLIVAQLKKEWANTPWAIHIQAVAAEISRSAKRYNFDPLLILALIKNESRLHINARGNAGEIGLMQILPNTAAWIAGRKKIYLADADQLYDPVVNIQIGTAYLNYLRQKFDSHSGHYLAAYNMGAGNLYRALKNNLQPRAYLGKVMEHYIELYRQIAGPMQIAAQ